MFHFGSLCCYVHGPFNFIFNLKVTCKTFLINILQNVTHKNTHTHIHVYIYTHTSAHTIFYILHVSMGYLGQMLISLLRFFYVCAFVCFREYVHARVRCVCVFTADHPLTNLNVYFTPYGV